jgi:hypothetical protein
MAFGIEDGKHSQRRCTGDRRAIRGPDEGSSGELVRRSDAVDLAQRRGESVIGINLFPVLPLSILVSGGHAIEPYQLDWRDRALQSSELGNRQAAKVRWQALIGASSRSESPASPPAAVLAGWWATCAFGRINAQPDLRIWAASFARRAD